MDIGDRELTEAEIESRAKWLASKPNQYVQKVLDTMSMDYTEDTLNALRMAVAKLKHGNTSREPIDARDRWRARRGLKPRRKWM